MKRYVITDIAEAMPLVAMINDHLMEHAAENPHTLKARRIDLFNYLAFMASKIDSPAFSDVSRSSIIAFRDDRKITESPATVNRRIATVAAFVRSVQQKHGLVDRLGKMKQLPRNEGCYLSLTAEEAARVVAVAKTANPATRCAISIILNTGLRVNETRLLTVGQISDDWRWFQKVVCKGRKMRNIAINATLKSEIDIYREIRNGPWKGPYPVLTSSEYQKNIPSTYVFDQKTLYLRIRKAMEAAGVDKALAHPHTLRHTFAALALKKAQERLGGADALILLRDLLGHSDIKTTMRYLTKSQDDIRAVIDSL